MIDGLCCISLVFMVVLQQRLRVKAWEKKPSENLINLNALEKASRLSLSCSCSGLAQNFDFKAISRGVKKKM